MVRGIRVLVAAAALCLPALALADAQPVDCIAPAKPGGGFDLTCKLLRELFATGAAGPPVPVQVRYLPGGIGAVAFHRAVSQQWGDPRQVVAFSSGSLLNLAQGKFGPHQPSDVRWLATLGVDYGVVAVRKDSPFKSLAMLRDALGQNPAAAVFGAGGALGSQDWVKAALLVRTAGADHRSMRFVSFEGGGQAIAALKGGHVDVFCGDAAEAAAAVAAGEIRVLAVLSERRLRGPLAGVPTAREQGIDLTWPTVRGLYMGPAVPQKAYDEWAAALRKAAASPGTARLAEAYGLQPQVLVGEDAVRFVEREVRRMRETAQELGLRTP